MKQILPLLFCFPFLLNAQNWSPVNLQDRYNFQSENANYISNTIWVDSLEIINGDSVFFLNRIVKDCPECDIDFPERYKIANQGQFLQKRIIKQTNGYYKFEGEQTFYLKADAALNDTWVYDSLQLVNAELIELGEEAVFGVMDSVKTVLLSTSDTLKFSKNYGMLVFQGEGEKYDIKGIEGRNIGELVPDYWDFHDYDIGDVFQYDNFNFGLVGTLNGISKITVLDRIENDSQLIYNINVIRSDTLESFMGVEYVYGSNDYSKTYVHPSDWYYYQIYNNQLIQHELGEGDCGAPSGSPYYRISKLFKDPVSGRVSQGTGEFLSTPSPTFEELGYSFINPTSDTLIQSSCFSEFYFIHTEGLGRVYNYESIIDNTSRSQLIGYIKGGDTTGVITPDEDLLLANDLLENDLQLSIQPNPSNGDFYLSFESSDPLSFELYNTSGQLVYSDKSPAYLNQQTINIQNHPSGIYFLKVRNEHNFHTYKLVKQ